ncbi:MAG TPA: ADP-ribosylglycohydrolase family protein [Acidimicrobiia bacterium]|nr:ADP-ribosylglycohydrolase family protein [Acidimicrobiia bacterium]
MSDEGRALFSLPVGEGAGAILGLAAGDTAGGASDKGYSSSTQQAVVVAYHLFRHGYLDRDALTVELAELDGDERDPSVYRALSPDMRRWLDSVRAGEADYGSEPSLDPAVRAVPLGMWFRRRPEDLVTSTLDCARVTHLDAPSAVLTTAVAAAVAGGCFAQNGRDLVMAVVEVARQAVTVIQSDDLRYAHSDQVDEVISRLRRSADLIGTPGPELTGALGDDPAGMVAAALSLTAPVTSRPHRPIEEAVEIGGSPLGAIVGAVLGARVGVRVWPWDFPNDTWFVAMGERLVAGKSDLAELPVPYAVEQRITYASPDPQL